MSLPISLAEKRLTIIAKSRILTWMRAVAEKKSVVVLFTGVMLLCASRESKAEVHARAAFGQGLAYGSPILGGGLELEISDHLSILGGIGILTAERPWAYGIRVYLQRPDSRWRLHGSAFRWLEGSGAYFGVDHDVGESSGVILTYGVGVFQVNLSTAVGSKVGLTGGLSLGIGYRF